MHKLLSADSWTHCSYQPVMQAVAYLSVALPSSMSPCFMSSNSFRDSAVGRSLQGLGLFSNLHMQSQLLAQIVVELVSA